MKKIPTELKDCYIIEPTKFGDSRGYFSPYFINKEFAELGFKNVCQTNRSCSSKGVLRGLHFQKDPKCQAKIVEVIKGRAIDVVVDMRIDSPTYGKYTSVELTADNNRQLFVPRGFAHGFIALEDETVFQYIVDNDYAPKLEGGIKWDDPDINIKWQEIIAQNHIEHLELSDKDQLHPSLKENTVIFKRNQSKYLITGFSGQLGYDLKRELINQGIAEENILAPTHQMLDITDSKQVMNLITNFKPDVIFHCAAWTNVDKAEEMPESAYAVNVEGTKNITDASIEVGAKLVYVSTDYVFDGTKKGAYLTTDQENPQNVYGQTKLAGEKEACRNPKHFIARTSWVFGINGKNFIKTMLRLGENHSVVNVVDDQVGSPTYTVDLAKLLIDLAQTDSYGTYHTTNEENCSWAELAEYIFEVNKMNTKVNKVSTEEYLALTNAKQAYRPHNSILDKSDIEKIGLSKLPSWQDALVRFSNELAAERLVLNRNQK